MLWLFLSLFAALGGAFKDVFQKRALANVDYRIVAWSVWVYSLPVFLIAIIFTGIPVLKDGFWIYLAFNTICNTAAFMLYAKALENADISLVAPLVTFTPLFLLITSPLITKEYPNSLGMVGVLFIVVGSYVLNVREDRTGWTAPIRALLFSQSARFMLIVAMIWSITSNVGKLGMLSSSPAFWPFAESVAISSSFALIVPFVTQPSQIIYKARNLAPIGCFWPISFGSDVRIYASDRPLCSLDQAS